MEKLKAIKDKLVNCVESQVEKGLGCVNTKELGEAIDMIKDMEEAMYYCSVVKAMENSTQEQEMLSRINQYKPETRDINRDQGRMYYPTDVMPVHDLREGRSPISRKHYMESKEMHRDIAEQKKELEHYIQELSEDIMDMIKNASQEEKTMLSQKLSNLASSIK